MRKQSELGIRGTTLLVGAIIVAFLGLLVWSEIDSWKTEVRNIQDDAINSAKSLARHADDTVELTSLPVASVVALLQFQGITARSISEAGDLIDRLDSETPRIEELLVFDENGGLLIASGNSSRQTVNAANMPFFIKHRNSPNRERMLGDPIISVTSGHWVIPVSMRINKPDGSFAGVAVATIDTRYFADFYKSLQTGAGAATALVRMDGTLMARQPFDPKAIGKSLAGTALFDEQLKLQQFGTYNYISPFDGVERIGGFYRNGDSDLIVVSAMSTSEAMALWVANAQFRWMFFAVLLIAAAILLIRFVQQRHHQAESDSLLKRREWEFRVLAETSNDMFGRVSTDGIFQYVSPGSRKVLGVEPETLVGTNPFALIHPDDLPKAYALHQRLLAGEDIVLEHRRAGTGDRVEWLETTVVNLPFSEVAERNGVVALTRNVTERKSLEMALAEMAVTDWLTGLPNRRAFDARLDEEIRRSHRSGQPVSLIMIDIDRFKLFNDTYGHEGGDLCLRSVAQALRMSARRPADFVGRYGGEEFAVILPETSASGAIELAEKMRDAVAALTIPHRENPPWQHVTISLGVSTGQGRDTNAEELFRLADHRLYAAKNAGRNRVQQVEAA